MVDDKIYSMVKVYELGSFVAAAKALNLTQPAVSQHIKAIEQEFGVTIFDRQHGKVAVTRQGEKILRTAQKMIGMEMQIAQELRDNNAVPSKLTIGITHTAECNPIVEALARFSRSNNDVQLKIVTKPSDKLYRALEQYEADLIVVNGQIRDTSLEYINLGSDSLMAFVSRNHPLAKRDSVSLSRLKTEPLILRLPYSGTQELFTSHLRSRNESIADFRVVIETDNVATIKELVMKNFGCTILPKSACMDEIRDGSLAALEVEDMDMKRDMLIAFQKDFRYPDTVREIADTYRKLVNGEL